MLQSTQLVQEPADCLISSFSTEGASGFGRVWHAWTDSASQAQEKQPQESRCMPCTCPHHHACRSTNQGQERVASCTAPVCRHCQSPTLHGQSGSLQLLWPGVDEGGSGSGLMLREFRRAYLGSAGQAQYFWQPTELACRLHSCLHLTVCNAIVWKQMRVANCTCSSQTRYAHLYAQQCLSSLPPVSGRRCP